MTDKEIACPLELELQELFGEDSYQLERKPCTGKYCGHWDYTLVFGLCIVQPICMVFFLAMITYTSPLAAVWQICSIVLWGDGPYQYPASSDGGQHIAVPEATACPLPLADIVGLSAHFPRDDWGEYSWGFTCFSRQNHAKVVLLDGVDEIMLGVQSVQGGGLCEMAIRWYMIKS